MQVKYCPVCRSALQPRAIDGISRLACSSSACGFIHWNNPIPIVAALVQREGLYVLARNTSWPADVFSLITGFLDNGEAPAAAVAREVQEELGLRADDVELVGHFPLRELNQLVIAYVVQARGELTLKEEIAEVKAVSAAELAVYDFGPLELTRSIVSCALHRGTLL